MFKKADLSDLAGIVEFSQELKAQNAKMSFTEFDNNVYVGYALGVVVIILGLYILIERFVRKT